MDTTLWLLKFPIQLHANTACCRHAVPLRIIYVRTRRNDTTQLQHSRRVYSRNGTLFPFDSLSAVCLHDCLQTRAAVVCTPLRRRRVCMFAYSLHIPAGLHRICYVAAAFNQKAYSRATYRVCPGSEKLRCSSQLQARQVHRSSAA